MLNNNAYNQKFHNNQDEAILIQQQMAEESTTAKAMKMIDESHRPEKLKEKNKDLAIRALSHV